MRISLDRNALLALILILAAVVMATGHDGWGWLILVAIFLL